MVDLIVRAELDRAECLRALTAALLLGRDRAEMRDRAGRHGVDLSAPRIVCLFTRRDERGALSEEAVAHLGPVAADSWSVGMSSPCYQISDCQPALAEAERALSACTESGAPVATVDELGASYLLTFGIDPDDAARFARTVMAPLLEDPSEASNALIETLKTFFACRNIRLTAKQLGVHENTIRYQRRAPHRPRRRRRPPRRARNPDRPGADGRQPRRGLSNASTRGPQSPASQ